MKIFHPDATSCSWDGEEYRRGEDGAFDVPAEALPALASHGFTTSRPAAAQRAPIPADQVDELVHHLDEVDAELAATKAHADELEHDRSEKGAKLAEAEMEISRLQVRIHELQVRIHELEAELEAATAPPATPPK